MKKLTYKELRNLWLDFYKQKQHAIINSASVVPQNDASVLFINSGMHPLVPYLMGENHPAGKRLANIQKCVRTGDIEEVGDPTHLTFFEMMGNWSLGDYFKKEKVAWSYEFLTGEKWLAIDPKRVFVTCLEGDKECEEAWLKAGITKERIYFLDKSENWWQLPSGTGPCGPCSEMFMELKSGACEKGDKCDPTCYCGRFVEIGNDVYMEYVIDKAGGKPVLAKQKNVDTGMGLERLLCLSNGLKSIYQSEIFMPAIQEVEKSQTASIKHHFGPRRVLVEHTRAACVIIGDGISPSNTGQGYVLRRLIRRAVRMANKLGCGREIFTTLINFFVDSLGEFYPEIRANRELILKTYLDEVAKFEKTLEQGLKEFEKVTGHFMKNVTGEKPVFNGKTAFRLYETFGFPVEMTQELCAEIGLTINMDEYNEAKKKHAAASQTAAAGSFKGGLADTGGETIRLHTAAHLLLCALRETFGTDVIQKGSNITPERLRFDFNLGHKMTDEEKTKIETRVNELISKKLPVTVAEMNIKDAEKMGATGTFHGKYGDIVKVYSVGDVYHEFCGGPHATNTGELGKFKITKEESVSAGVRRIKGVLK